MAYGQQYQSTFATKNNVIGLVKIYTNGYTGSVVEYPGVAFNIQYLASSDDIYEPIYASQLSITLDVTDDLANVPNFATLEDRKYYVELYLNSVLEWVGFVLSDNIQFSYTTGRRQLIFDAIDGLGFLKDIPFTNPESTGYPNTRNNPQTIVYYFTKCLQQIAFPTGRNIIAACSYYAQFMEIRSPNKWKDPFNQGYITPTCFLTDNNKYDDCLNILRSILISFGCRIFQAHGKWYIVAINQWAADIPYYTEYDESGSVINSGQLLDIKTTIQAYSGNTSGMYFVNNNQVKLFKKGFNNFYCNQKTTYAPNYIPNADLKLLTSGSADFWTTFTQVTGGSVVVTVNADLDVNYFTMTCGASSGGAVGQTNVSCATGVHINEQDRFTFGFTIYVQEFPSTMARAIVPIILTGYGSGAPIYYINVDGIWQNNAIAPYDNYYKIPMLDAGATNTVNVFSCKTPPAPIAGLISIQVQQKVGVTSANLTIGNFDLTINGTIISNEIKSVIATNEQYSKTINLPFGYPIYTGDGIGRYNYNASLGIISVLDSGIYKASTGWFRYGKPFERFQGLSQLIMKEYINSYRKNLINVNASVFGMITYGLTYSAAELIKMDDTDPAQISVITNKYINGNMTVDLVNSESAVTYLDISNTEIESTINTKFTVTPIQ
jgi:hypothetical protein